MDVHFQLNGTDFVWNARKAASNRNKHDGVTFEQAVTVFSIHCCGWSMPRATMKRVTR